MSSRQTTTTQGTQQQSGNQSQDFTNRYGWEQNPGSADIHELRGYNEEIDPSIDASYARRQSNLKSRFMNPLGQYTTPAMKDAIQQSQEGEMEQDYGQARRQAWNDKQQRTGQRLAGLAALTAPTMVHEGGHTEGTYSGSGSNTGETSQTTPMLPQILGGAASIGAAAL